MPGIKTKKSFEKEFIWGFFLIFISFFFLKPNVSQAASIVISSSLYSLVSADSDNPDYPAQYAIDGSTSTFWHTEWTPASSIFPHEIIIDIGNSSPLVGLQYLPRQDGKNYGYIKSYEIYISNDLNSWGNVVTSGSFDTFRGDISQKEIAFTEKSGKYVRFVSLSSADGTPYAAAAEIRMLATSYEPAAEPVSITIPSQYLTLLSVDSDNSEYPAQYAIDGKTSTFWHTEWTPASSIFPHEIIIDIGNSSPLVGLQYLPRQDGKNYGYVKNYEIYVSDNLSSWGNKVASGSFNTFRGDTSQKEIFFTEKSGKYVKVVFLSSADGTPYAAAAEIKILATSYTPPATIPVNPLIGSEISVGLWSYTKDSLNETPFKVEANKKYNVKNSAGNVIASVENNVITRVSYVSDQNFKIYNSIPETLSNKEVVFEATDGNNSDMIFDIYRPDSSYDQYRGKIKIRYTDSNNIWVINTLPMEHYTWGMGETTGTGPFEHTKLMTMIFRTYGYQYITWSSTKWVPYGFRIRSDSGSQIYRGYDWETTYPNIKKAAENTRGKIVTYNGEVALTPYSSWTDGRTRSFQERWGSTEYPWCKSVKDPYGKHPTMTTAQLEAAGNHMVGVSANGSVKLAGSSYNKTYDWILKYYYKGIDITTKY